MEFGIIKTWFLASRRSFLNNGRQSGGLDMMHDQLVIAGNEQQGEVFPLGHGRRLGTLWLAHPGHRSRAIK